MKDRLFQLIESLNLSNVQFADSIGIERSTLSHIKTERSKPSLELVHKIVKQYPEVSLEWLILGEGSMKHHTGDSHEPNLFDQLENSITPEPVVVATPPVANSIVPEREISTPKAVALDSAFESVKHSSERRIERILVF